MGLEQFDDRPWRGNLGSNSLIEKISIFDCEREDGTVPDLGDRILTKKTTPRPEFSRILEKKEICMRLIVLFRQGVDELIGDVELFLSIWLDREDLGDIGDSAQPGTSDILLDGRLSDGVEDDNNENREGQDTAKDDESAMSGKRW